MQPQMTKFWLILIGQTVSHGHSILKGAWERQTDGQSDQHEGSISEEGGENEYCIKRFLSCCFIIFFYSIKLQGVENGLWMTLSFPSLLPLY